MNKKEIKISDEIIRKYMNLKSINKICEKLNIPYSNLLKGRTSEYNKKLIILEIKHEIINFIMDTY